MKRFFTHITYKTIIHPGLLKWILGLLIFCSFSLAVQAQTFPVTNIDFSNASQVVFAKSVGNVIEVANGQGRIEGENGNRGYSGYFAIASPISLEPGFDYRISVKVRAVGQAAALRINKAAATTGIPTGTNLGTHTVPGNNTVQTFTTTTTVSTAESRYIGFFLESTGANGLSVYIDDIVITKICHPLPVTITPTGSATICQGENLGLIAMGAESYTWSPSTGLSSTTGAFVTASPDTTTTYTVTGKNSKGCSSTAQITVTVNPAPVASISTNDETIFCEGGTAVLQAEGNGAYNYQWLRNGSSISDATESSFTAVATGNYSVRVTNASTGCRATSNIIPVTVDPKPNATITTDSPLSICQGDFALLEANHEFTYLTYQWLKNEQEITGATSRNFQARESGSYSVRVTNSDSRKETRCTRTSESITITVNPNPVAEISTENLPPFCEGDAALLQAEEGAGYTYQWLRNGDLLTGATESSLSVEESGNYSVNVTLGSCTVTSNIIPITVNPFPVASINTPESTTLCEGESALLRAVTGDGYSYQWFQNGEEISGATSSTLTATEAGNYNLDVTRNNCTATSNSISITVNPSPVASISTTDNIPFCEGETAVLQAEENAAYDYQWLRNGGVISGVTESSLTVAQTGNYSVRVTNRNTLCTSTSNIIPVTVDSKPNAVITTDDQTTFCQGDFALLEANHEFTYLTYQWLKNEQEITGATSRNFQARESGSYSVRVTNSDSRKETRCTRTSESIEITVMELPEAVILEGASITFCEDETRILHAQEGEGYTYQWIKGNVELTGEISSSLPVSEPGKYTVRVTNSNNCPATSEQINVIVNNLPVALIQEGENTSFCEGESTVLHAQEGTGYSYQWLLNGGIISGATTSTLTVTEPGSYTIEVTGADGCSTTSDPVSPPTVVSELPLPAAPSATPAPNCGPGILTLTASGGTEGNYRWYMEEGGTAISGAFNSSYTTGEISETTTFYVSVLNADGCESSRTAVQAIIYDVPDQPSAKDGRRCGPGSVDLVVIEETPPAGSYRWYTADGTPIAGETSATYTTPELGEGENPTYYVSVVSSNGCESEKRAIQAIVNEIPDAPTAEEVERCGSGTIVITAVGGTENGFRWYTEDSDDALIAGETTATYKTPSLNATTTYYVSVVNTDDCESERTPVRAVINPIPAIPTAADVARCGPGTVVLTATGTPTDGSYRWYTADEDGALIAGEISATFTTPTLSATTTYYVSAESVNDCESSRIPVKAIIKPLPEALAGSNQELCAEADGTTAFTLAGSVSNGTGAWSLVSTTGGASVSIANPAALNTGVTVTGSGTVTLQLTTTSNQDCGTATDEVVLTVKPLPVALAGSNQELCAEADGTTAFTLAGSVSNGTGAWSLVSTTGGASVSIANPAALNTGVTVTGSGTVTLQLTTTSNQDCGTATDEVVLTVKPLPQPVISNIKPVYYTLEGPVTLLGNPAGGKFEINGTGFNGTFDPCNVGAGTKTIRYTYTNANTQCSNFVEYEITIRKSTYSVVNWVPEKDFTICKGNNTSFTARVYRDVQVIYPYTQSPRDIGLRDASTYNENYTAYFRALYNEPSWEPSDIERAYPERLLEPIVINPDPALSIGQQVNVSHLLLDPNLFNYQWLRNGSAQGQNNQVRNIAALSATDYIRVLAQPKNTNNCIEWTEETISQGSVTRGMPSNYLFFSEPKYDITLADNAPPVNICPGDNSVVIEFPVGNLKWTEINATITWKLRRGGVAYTLQSWTIPPTATGATISEFFRLTAEEIKLGLQAANVTPAELINSDEVYIEYVSDIDREVRRKCNQSSEVNQSQMVRATVNDVTASATPQDPVICLNDAATFNVNVTSTGTASVNYNWLVAGTTYTTNGPSLTISNPQSTSPGVYNVSVTVSNGCKSIPLTVGTLTVKELATFTVEGGGQYCELTPAARGISLSSSQEGVNYRLIRTESDGSTTVVESKTGSGGNPIAFTPQTAPGTYTVEGGFTSSPACSGVMNSSATIIATPALSPTGDLEVWWVGEGEDQMWEVTAHTNHEALDVGTVSYNWYTKMNEADDWTFFKTTRVDSVLVEPNTLVQVIIQGPTGACLRDLVLESINSVPQPVELIYLKANQQGEEVLLRWATATEKYNTGFNVQLSTDGMQYRTLAFVETRNGSSLEVPGIYLYP